VHIKAPGSHFVVARRFHIEEFRGLPGDCVETEASTGNIAIPPLLTTIIGRSNAGSKVAITSWNVPVEHFCGLTDMVIDADQY
jgi:hypothetical protein